MKPLFYLILEGPALFFRRKTAGSPVSQVFVAAAVDHAITLKTDSGD